MPATILDLLPLAIDIWFTRRDTFPFEFVLEVDGSPVDITGSVFQLTVNAAIDGSGAAVFQINQSNTPGADGVVEFTPSAANATQAPADYYYDVEWTNGSDVRTVAKGIFRIAPDIGL